MTNYKTTIDEIAQFIEIDRLRNGGATMAEAMEKIDEFSGGMVHNFITKYNAWISSGRPNPLTWNN